MEAFKVNTERPYWCPCCGEERIVRITKITDNYVYTTLGKFKKQDNEICIKIPVLLDSSVFQKDTERSYWCPFSGEERTLHITKITERYIFTNLGKYKIGNEVICFTTSTFISPRFFY